MCSLEFDSYDPQNYFSFRRKEQSCTDEELRNLLNVDMRSPIQDLVFRNRRNDVVVGDGFFIGGVHEDGTVGIRDYRL